HRRAGAARGPRGPVHAHGLRRRGADDGGQRGRRPAAGHVGMAHRRKLPRAALSRPCRWPAQPLGGGAAGALMPVHGTFSSLAIHNYRVWAIGALVSNVGTWMQRIGQDWLVLVVLTDNNATAMGIVMALQFGPPLLLLPLTGWAADHLDRRRLLLFTQGAAGLLALGLGVVTLLGV